MIKSIALALTIAAIATGASAQSNTRILPPKVIHIGPSGTSAAAQSNRNPDASPVNEEYCFECETARMQRDINEQRVKLAGERVKLACGIMKLNSGDRCPFRDQEECIDFYETRERCIRKGYWR